MAWIWDWCRAKVAILGNPSRIMGLEKQASLLTVWASLLPSIVRRRRCSHPQGLPVPPAGCRLSPRSLSAVPLFLVGNSPDLSRLFSCLLWAISPSFVGNSPGLFCLFSCPFFNIFMSFIGYLTVFSLISSRPLPVISLSFAGYLPVLSSISSCPLWVIPLSFLLFLPVLCLLYNECPPLSVSAVRALCFSFFAFHSSLFAFHSPLFAFHSSLFTLHFSLFTKKRGGPPSQAVPLVTLFLFKKTISIYLFLKKNFFGFLFGPPHVSGAILGVTYLCSSYFCFSSPAMA